MAKAIHVTFESRLGKAWSKSTRKELGDLSLRTINQIVNNNLIQFILFSANSTSTSQAIVQFLRLTNENWNYAWQPNHNQLCLGIFL
jgi:hypothetical protein